MKKRVLYILFGVLVIASAGSFYFVLKERSSFVPLEFFEARGRGSEIAKLIVSNSEDNSRLLANISLLDQERNYAEALINVSRAVLKNKENNQEALRLSSQLEILAKASASVKPEKARQAAIEAVSNGVTMVARLLKYNAYLSELFELLKLKFSNEEVNINGQIQNLVSTINEEARMINDLNQRFSNLLEEFDRTVKEK